MKLSEAILLGAVGTQQGIGQLRSSDGATCAMGAAYAAIGIQCGLLAKDYWLKDPGFKVPPVFDEPACVPLEWKWALQKKETCVTCPAGCDEYCTSFSIMIMHLNDIHTWTRPRIAAWVAELEQQYLPKEDHHGMDQGTASPARGTHAEPHVERVAG